MLVSLTAWLCGLLVLALGVGGPAGQLARHAVRHGRDQEVTLTILTLTSFMTDRLAIKEPGVGGSWKPAGATLNVQAGSCSQNISINTSFSLSKKQKQNKRKSL